MKVKASLCRTFRFIAVFATALALMSLAPGHSQALRQTGQAQVDRAVRDLRDADPPVRGDAIRTLAKLAPQQHAADIARMLNDDFPWVVETALSALADIGAKQYAGDIAGVLKGDAIYWIKRDAMTALWKLGAAEYAKDIVPFLRSRESDLKKSAIIALGLLGAKQYAPDIVLLLKDGDFSVRAYALTALGDLGASQHAADVAGLLADRNSLVRQDAAQALAKMSARDYGPGIAKLLLDEEGWVRKNVTQLLQKIGYVPLASDVFKIASDAVVMIHTECAGGTATGAGFAVSVDGRILTNKHVIEPPGELGSVQRITVRFRDGRTFGVAKIRKHPSYDLALIQIQNPPKEMLYLQFKKELYLEEDLPLIGEDLIMIGHPAGLGWSLSEGRVSQIRDDPDGGKNVWIQTDGAINPGNSGGPMLNRYAQIVGIATEKLEKVGDHYVSGLNFGISAPIARKFVFGF